MSTPMYQLSDEVKKIAARYEVSSDFVAACSLLCPDTVILAHIACLVAVTNTYLAYVALKAMVEAMQTTNTHTDSEYAI